MRTITAKAESLKRDTELVRVFIFTVHEISKHHYVLKSTVLSITER